MIHYIIFFFAIQGQLELKADSLDKIIAQQIKSGDFVNALKSAEELLDIYKTQNENKKISDCIATIGFIHSKLNNSQKAIEFYKQSLETKITISDSIGLLKVLFLSGILFKDLKNFKESACNFETALDYAEKLNETSLRRSILFGLSKVYYEIGETFLVIEEKDSAEYYYLKAIEKAKIVNDTNTLAQSYHSLGVTYIYLFNDVKKGRDAYLSALKLYRNSNDRNGEVDVLNDLCRAYLIVPDDSIAKGIEHGEKALSLADSVNYLEGYAEALENLGDLNQNLDNFNQSVEFYNKSIKTLEKLNDKWTITRVLYKLARLSFDNLPADTTLKICNIGKITAIESNNQDYLKSILGIEYLVHNRRHDYDNAIKTKKELLDIYESEDNAKEKINTLIDLANVHLKKDDYKKFENLLKEAENLIEKIDYIEGEIKIMETKGDYYLKKDKIDSLVVITYIILQKLPMIQDKELISDVFLWLGVVALLLDDFYKSIEFLNEGLKIIDEAISEKKGADHISVIQKRSLYSAKSYLLSNIGFLYQSMGLLNKAEEFYKKAIKIAKDEANEKDLSQFYTNLSLLYLNTGNYEQFNNYLNDVEDEYQKMKDKDGLAFVLELRGIEMMKKYQWKNAIDFLKKADSLRNKPYLLNHFLTGLAYREIGDYKYALTMFKKTLERSEVSYSPQLQGLIMTELGRLSIAMNDLENAKWFFESARESYNRIDSTYNTVELEMGWALLNLRNNDTTKAINHYKNAIQIIEQVSLHLTTDLMKVSLAASKVNIYEELVKILLVRRDYTEAFNYVEKNRGRAFLDLMGTAELQLKPEDRLRINELKERETKLAFLRNDLKIGENEITGPKLRDIETKITEAKKELERTQPEVASLVSVSSLTLKEFQQLLKDEIVIEYYFIGEDGYLFCINASEIEVHKLEKNYSEISNLCEYFRSSLMKTTPPFDEEFYEPSNELYKILIYPIINKIANHKTYLIPYGVLHYLPFNVLHDGKKFLIEQTEICYLPSASALKFILGKMNENVNKDRFLGIANPDLGDTTLFLKFAEEEVKTIAQFFTLKKIFYKKDASEGIILSHGKAYDILHFACHGVFNEKRPLYSALLLSEDKGNNGRLEAYELFGIELREANLIVLSACQTALTKFTKGEDLIGLSRGFFYSGTPSLIASLWKVDDRSTGYLMVEFYKNLKNGKSKIESLKNAQIATKEKFSHPFYWAPFVLIGDWR